MSRRAAENKTEMLKQLKAMVAERLPDKRSEPLVRFIEGYFAHVAEADLLQWRLDDLYGATLAAWQFMQDRSSDETLIRVFNPDYERHGWQSTHTVIEVLQSDMPFIVDSLRMELNRRNLSIHAILNTVFSTRRDKDGKLVELMERDARGRGVQQESLVAIEVDRHTNPQQLDELKQALLDVLNEVKAAVSDFDAMLAKADELLEGYAQVPQGFDEADVQETRDFIRWLKQHFTFLGYDEYALKAQDKQQGLELVSGSGLGLLRHDTVRSGQARLSTEAQDAGVFTLIPDLLSFTKSSRKSRVHRPAYPDYISIQRFDGQGKLIGEVRFLGLYTSAVYLHGATEIPVVRRKIEEVMKRSGLHRHGHDWKELQQILEIYPRDDLFQSSINELFDIATGILHIHERRQIRLFLRRDYYGQFFSALVYVPREIYSTDFRLRVQQILQQALGCDQAEFTTYFSESVLARTQFLLRRSDHKKVTAKYRVDELEQQVSHAASSWSEELYEALIDSLGEEQGIRAYNHYHSSFSAGYRSDFAPRAAVVDIQHMETLDSERKMALSFYEALEREPEELNFKLYHHGEALPLSDVLPILENLGLRVIDEHPYQVEVNGECIWIHDFNLRYTGSQQVTTSTMQSVFEEAFLNVWYGRAGNDEFNKLVLGAQLHWREVALLRAYAGYMKQIHFPIGQEAISIALRHHVDLTRLLIELFEARFDPKQASVKKEEKVKERILEGLEHVASLNEDQAIRQYLTLIEATLRTNFYQLVQGRPKEYFSLKLSPRDIPQVPEPKPLYEIFVHSPRVEGVHLRGGKVARGGLRWSDRLEDFRTEVLGLVKAQQVKNAVIVPVGAKGGFVARQLHTNMTREEWMQEGIACYRTFIRALLDVTDNLVDGEVAPPDQLVRHDEDDTYLVVAADKGTATFSDIANEIAAEYGFWLGDAFASGGSQGYDHKKMGITARGAWVSVERHFRELGINTATDPFTVIGVGDMSGDVFGNGMLRSDKIRLVAAFNHQHIFIDPDPDPATSFAERERLFALPRSGWADYDAELISRGGGVFQRSAKSITLTPEIKEMTGLSGSRVTPTELISALLCAKVDLIWNGGIGTYIKASDESHAEVGDKSNDSLRVNAGDVRAKVIGEGGNLGVTQRGRMELAAKGCRLNTDFIDNAGGVDCSDHEVNIKILLNTAVNNGDMTAKQRNRLLSDMTDDVAELVLQNNYRQVQAISLAEVRSAVSMAEYRRFINALEAQGKLNRALEFLPGDDQLAERQNAREGFNRPELSVLVSYSKADLKEQLQTSSVADEPYLAKELMTAFPARLQKSHSGELEQHRLRREIIATQIANQMVNLMGINFAERLLTSTGAEIEHVVRAYVLARDVFSLQPIWEGVEALDYRVDAGVQLDMMHDLQHLIRRATRWFVRNRPSSLDCQSERDHFAPHLEAITRNLGELLCGEPFEIWHSAYSRYTDAGVPARLAQVVAGSRSLYSSLSIIEVASKLEVTVEAAAQAFFGLGERLELQWFSSQLNELSISSYWQALARDTFRDDLDAQQRALTASVLRAAQHDNKPVPEQLASWLEQNQPHIERWLNVLAELRNATTQDYAMYTVAVRELADMARCSAQME
ncbi:NAD-glutamate dehydrogenase [Marinobacterium sediminicola]|uniref:Glutamate dehydrogenase (NAD) n=1 Tax=Marinobacterium sediminicola TaxID=518898 RepID=A0ABY1RWZ3_9GAMM|nr:NAD-glutamate dehydrogenase [Marinobacterium sediminicola]ULG67953.1 NAD-glutamate dehydrogenase [Marinobacterium sediminicola]SMR71312.1 glutamate dehydrogenase (NAD) [Marinobacterium sediminicola]